MCWGRPSSVWCAVPSIFLTATYILRSIRMQCLRRRRLCVYFLFFHLPSARSGVITYFNCFFTGCGPLTVLLFFFRFILLVLSYLSWGRLPSLVALCAFTACLSVNYNELRGVLRFSTGCRFANRVLTGLGVVALLCLAVAGLHTGVIWARWWVLLEKLHEGTTTCGFCTSGWY